MRKSTSLAFVLVAAFVWIPVASATLAFNLTPGPLMNPQASAGFQTAADRWASLRVDAVTVNINVNFTTLSSGIPGQSSHWKVNLGIGIMNPTVASGVLLSISALNTQAFNVIGRNLAEVPEPRTIRCSQRRSFFWLPQEESSRYIRRYAI